MKLHQVVAIAKGSKTRCQDDLTSCYQKLQNTKPFGGIRRTYSPRDEDGEHLPDESNRVQITVEDVLKRVADAFNEVVDIAVTQDMGNRDALADIIVDGQIIASRVPATTLIFLEKKIVELNNIISKIPTLPVDKEWHEVGDGTYSSTPTNTTRSKKTPRNHVLAEATPEHPAQVQVYNEDVIVGDWTTIVLSGAIPPAEKRAMQIRQRALHDAIRAARARANDIDVKKREIGNDIITYLFGNPKEV